MKKHDEDCDRYQATLHSEGPWGDPDIIPESYACYCEASDWLDDKATYTGQGAFVTLMGDDGHYTDFQLTASQVRVVFRALAEHEEEG